MHIALVAAVAFSTAPVRKPATDDVWHGTYTCTQGKTAVTLRLHHEGAHVTGEFEFGPLAENPRVPHGKFEIHGTMDRERAVIEPGAWIERPDNYVTVGFTGTIDHDGRLLHGTIGFQGCGEIDLVHG